MRPIQLTIFLFFLPGVSMPTVRAADIDEDGINDALEETLIDMYRPMLHYDTSESVSPSTVDWFIRHSELIWRTSFQGAPLDIQILSNAQLNDSNNPESPLLLLQVGGGGSALFVHDARTCQCGISH